MPNSKKKDEKIIKAAKECLENYQERESDNIERAEEAIRFRSGEQWPSNIKNDRESPSQDGGARPCPVLDKTDQHVRQIVNEERQNRAAIKVRPVDDHADKDVAEVFTGIIRHIEDKSDAIEAYTTAGEHAIDGGFGFWRILTEYEDDTSFNQDIRIQRIPNRFSVGLGPHVDPSGADAKEGIIWEDMDLDEFKNKYPKAEEVGFDEGANWAEKDTVRVAEYMRIKEDTATIHLLEDGSVVMEDELEGRVSVKSRTSQIKSLMWYKLTAAEILEEAPMIGTFIPIIKVVGNELTMPDGKVRYSGAIEKAMDSQRLHNFAIANFIEAVALAPRSPWMAEKTQVDGLEQDFADANRLNIAVLKYNGTADENGQTFPMPTRLPPAGVSQGWQAMLADTEHGIEAAMGSYGPTVGAQSQEKSGVALQEQKEQGFVGNYHYPDNLSRSIQHCGRILVEWIPKVYDTERTARILGEEGLPEMAYLNPEQETAIEPRLDDMGQEIGSIYNLNVGKYDVSISTGPSYSAKRQEAAEYQSQILQANPEMMPIIGDIVFENMDLPGSDKIADRLKTQLPPAIQQMESDESNIDPQMQAQIQAKMQHVEQGMQLIQARGEELEQQAQELDSQAKESDMSKAELDSLSKQLSADRKVFMAEARTKQLEVEAYVNGLLSQLEEAKKPESEQDMVKVKVDMMQHDREMNLKEFEAGFKEGLEYDEEGNVINPTAESILTMCGSMASLSDRLNDISIDIGKPRQLDIQRDSNGDIVAVNGKPVARDGQGNLTGLSS